MGETESIAGRVLADKYLLIEQLGEGGFGSIWRGEHLVLKSPIAVKLIDLEVARREGAVERFLREAQATAALRSPHVVQVLDYGLDKRVDGGVEYEQPFIVMELLEGEDLASRIARIGALSPLEVLRVVTHVARAISRAHELQIVHRDLKPENIFLVNNGDEEVAKVLDFGVAKIASPMDLNRHTYTQTGSLVGTPYYMSPEQAQGNKTVDHRSDLWALGVIAFEMITGRRPFDSDALGDLVLCICVRELPVPSQFGPVPAGFDEWFARAVARDPEQRFQSARELALSLLELLEVAQGEVRYTTADDARISRSAPPPRVSSPSLNARASDAGLSLDIPSRPFHAPFAATVRDDSLARASLASTPPAARLSNHDLPLDLSQPVDADVEPRMSHWTLAGLSLLALASGAAVVYGLFHLLQGPQGEDSTLRAILNAQRSKDVSSSHSADSVKRRSHVIAPNRPEASSESGPSKAVANRPLTKGTSTTQEDNRIHRDHGPSVRAVAPNERIRSAAGASASAETASEPATGASSTVELQSGTPNSAPPPIDSLPMVTDPG